MNEKDLLTQAKKNLDQSTEALDAHTLSKLNRARQNAIEQLQQRPRQRYRQLWAPLGGVAAAILVTSIFLFRAEDIAVISDSTVDEIEIIAASDNLDLYEQLDFYLWLLEEESGAV